MIYRDYKDLKLSALGMGCMRFPLKDGAVDRAAAISLLRRAIDGGVTYVDTAYAYHDGESERIVGEALEGGYRERVLLATKLPMWLLKTPEDMERIFNEQMQKLRTDHVDIYLLHALDKERFEKALKLGALDFMRRLRAEGLEARLLLQVHDELIAECPEAEAERVAALLEEEMERAVQLTVPLIAEAHSGHSWAEAH